MFEDILKTVCEVLAKLTQKEVQPEDTLADLGLDSLDVVEAMLELEDAFPEANLDTYEPETTTSVRELAAKIDWMKVGE